MQFNPIPFLCDVFLIHIKRELLDVGSGVVLCWVVLNKLYVVILPKVNLWIFEIETIEIDIGVEWMVVD